MKQFVAFVKKHQPEILETEIFQDLKKWNKNPKGRGYRPNGIWMINDILKSHLTPYDYRWEMEIKLSKEEYAAYKSKMEETERVVADIYKLLHQFVYKNKDKYVIYIGYGSFGLTGFNIMTRNYAEWIGAEEFHKLEDSSNRQVDSSTIYTYDRYVTDRNGVTIIIENKRNVDLTMRGIDFSQIP